MNQNDGNEIRNIIEDVINTELNAGNRITKCNGTFIAQSIMAIVHKIIETDYNKEKMWEECGKEWLKEKTKQNKIEIENQKKQKQNKIEKENIIDINKTVKGNLLNQKLKQELENKQKKE